jgi:hypothetical protein
VIIRLTLGWPDVFVEEIAQNIALPISVIITMHVHDLHILLKKEAKK